MKQRSMIFAAAVLLPFAVAVAQTPPTPPVPVTPPAQPAPVVTPAPMVPLTPLTPLLPDPIYFDRDAIRRASEDARLAGQLAAEQGRIWAEEGRRIADEARIHAQQVAADFRFNFENNFRFEAPKFSAQTFTAGVPFQGQHLFSGRAEIAPPPVFQYQDPADSLYSLAREAFLRQDYSRAATRFAEVISKYPNSRQVLPSAYYQAFALYRVGTLEALRTSLKVLETHEQRFDYDREHRSDAPALKGQVLRALAERNESGVEAKLRDLYAKYPSTSCDKDAINIKSQVLNSLYQADPEAAMPFIRQHLATRDACSARLRESAVFLLANRPSPTSTALIVQVAREDTVRSVRRQAVEVLARMPGDDAINALQQFMQDPDESIQAAAVRALMRNDNPRARTAMRTLIDRRESPERQRLDAIRSFDRDNTSPEDATYLRGLFNRAGESDRIKDAVIQAISNVPTPENMKFLLDVAQNANESSSIRASALRRVTARQNLTTDNLIKLYDASDNRAMRQSLVSALAERPEPAAVNKLLDIVKLSTDPEVRSRAIQLLLRKNDKTITEKVLALIK